VSWLESGLLDRFAAFAEIELLTAKRGPLVLTEDKERSKHTTAHNREKLTQG
jgi:hypothetical protein